jgi:hypothetical protein
MAGAAGCALSKNTAGEKYKVQQDWIFKMSGGKGGSKTSTQVASMPGYAEGMGISNLEKADAIAGMGPIRNYGPTVAAFNPTQQAMFQNVGSTANAFGMQAPTDMMAGMPAATDFGGGMMGHSAAPMVDQQLAQLQANAPGQYAEMTGMYMDPVTGQRPTTGPFAPTSAGILSNILDEYGNLRIS